MPASTAPADGSQRLARACACGYYHGPVNDGPPAPDSHERWLDALAATLRPLDRVLRTRLRGADRIPDSRPLLFVGNHQLLALDTPFLLATLWRERRIALRPLADDFFYRFAPVGRAIGAFGIEPATPGVCARLMQERQCVLVYPGGAREAAKGEGRSYDLSWWDRLGFAQLALAQGCPVVPVVAHGLDDSVRIVLDREHYLRSPLRHPISWFGIRQDLLPPIFLPRRRPRLDFSFCDPIHVRRYAGRDAETSAHMLRADVATAIERELADLTGRARPGRRRNALSTTRTSRAGSSASW